MTGIVLITVGIVFIAIGIIFNIKSKTGAKDKPQKDPVPGRNNSKVSKEANGLNSEMINMIDLAVADGVLTDNEKQIIFDKSMELKMNIVEVEKYVNQEIQKKNGQEETKLIDVVKEAGDKFESLIAKKFNRNYFKIKEWAGDKYVEGIYAESTLNPDLVISFNLGKINQLFAVECKYRSKYIMDGIIWAKENQIKHYRSYQEKENIPVFVAIGVGGKPDSPDDLYIIPLREIENSKYIPQRTLNKFRKCDYKTKEFFYKPGESLLTLRAV